MNSFWKRRFLYSKQGAVYRKQYYLSTLLVKTPFMIRKEYFVCYESYPEITA